MWERVVIILNSVTRRKWLIVERLEEREGPAMQVSGASGPGRGKVNEKTLRYAPHA